MKVNETVLNFRLAGDTGSSVVFVHGSVGSLDDWYSQVGAFARSHRVLIYSRRSTGWSGYAGLQGTEVGARVKVCVVEQPHLLVPRVANLRDALVDPDGWDNGTCRWGI